MADPRKKIYPNSITSYVDHDTKSRLKTLQDQKGFTSEAETIRYFLDQWLDHELTGSFQEARESVS